MVTIFLSGYHYCLATILQQHTSKSSRDFTVLILCNTGDDSEENAKALIDSTQKEYAVVNPYLPLTELFKPDGEVKHAVINLTGQFITGITDEVISVEPKKIMDDYNKRQIPRFR